MYNMSYISIKKNYGFSYLLKRMKSIKIISFKNENIPYIIITLSYYLNYPDEKLSSPV